MSLPNHHGREKEYVKSSSDHIDPQRKEVEKAFEKARKMGNLTVVNRIVAVFSLASEGGLPAKLPVVVE